MGELDKFLDPKKGGAPTQFSVLEKRLEQVWDIAHDFGLDPFPTHFEVIPPTQMHEIAAYALPHRFSHWTHGREYSRHKMMHEHGLSRLYEVVINANPSQAYLLENNSDIENTVVMAHVLGHTDFFKHNRLFQATRRDMPHAASTYALQLKEFEFEFGRLTVERFLNSALAIAEHVDPHNVVRLPRGEQLARWKEEAEDDLKPKKATGEFNDLFPEDIEAERKRREGVAKSRRKIPLRPDADLPGSIADWGLYLEPWQRTALEITRLESLYFNPQRKTKIMNEGYASYWHKRIMAEMSDRGQLSQEEEFRWVAMHAGVVSPNPRSLNPYYLGSMMFDYLEDYANGNLTDVEKRHLEKAEVTIPPKYKGEYIGSPGHTLVRDVMVFDDDQSFIRNYFNQVVAERMHMFKYEEREVHGIVETFVADKGWVSIRDSLVKSLENSGIPYLAVVDVDHHRNGSLFVKHAYEGQELDVDYLQRTLPHLYNLWGRPVYIETVLGSVPTTYSFDGEKVHKKP